MEIRLIINFTIAILILLYTGFCWVNQGVHAKGKGWVTREYAPKTFWFCIIFYVVIAVGLIVSSFYTGR